MSLRSLNIQNVGRYLMSLPAERLDGLHKLCQEKMSEQGIQPSSRALRVLKLKTDGRVTGNLGSIANWIRNFNLADYPEDQRDSAARELQVVHACCDARLRQSGRV